MKKTPVNYKDYIISCPSWVAENVEWSISYSYNAGDTTSPRVLIVGDSICNAYQEYVRENLSSTVNVTYWASSKCVTHPNFLRELDYFLDVYKYDLILFNNGCHSIDNFPKERNDAYRSAVEFIMDKCPDIPLALVLCAPVKPDDATKKLQFFNDFSVTLAEEFNLNVVDLFTPMANIDKNKSMRDDFHWKKLAVKKQAKIVSESIIALLKPIGHNITQHSSLLGPSGIIK